MTKFVLNSNLTEASTDINDLLGKFSFINWIWKVGFWNDSSVNSYGMNFYYDINNRNNHIKVSFRLNDKQICVYVNDGATENLIFTVQGT